MQISPIGPQAPVDATVSHVRARSQCPGFSSLPQDATLCIMDMLVPEDVVSLGRASKHLHEIWQGVRARLEPTLLQNTLERRHAAAGGAPVGRMMTVLAATTGAANVLMHVKSLSFVQKRLNAEDVAVIVRCCPQLESLDLQDNYLKELSGELCHLKNLRVLNLRLNSITSVGPEVAHMQALEELNLTSNKLVSLPDAFAALPNLQALSVGYNKLSTLPPCIAHMPSLRRLETLHNCAPLPSFRLSSPDVKSSRLHIS